MVAEMANPVRRYAWGSHELIPQFLGLPADREPCAELWMGAHESASSELVMPDTGATSQTSVDLAELIGAYPDGMLGDAVAEGRLPFLVKLLGIAQPLSIQAHPDADQARTGFERENAADVPLDADDRNYRDGSPKPEMLVALSDVTAFVGFAEPQAILPLLGAVGVVALDEMRDEVAAGNLREAFSGVLHSDRDGLRPIVAAIAERCRALIDAGRHDELADRLKVTEKLALDFPDDPGVLATMLMNLVRLHPYESIAVPAGLVHAYVRGLGLEVQVNSDNVLRGGLTRKHIDVPELLSVLDFAPTADPVRRPVAIRGRCDYESPSDRFALARFDVAAGDATRIRVGVGGPRILVCAAGEVMVSTSDSASTTRLRRGASAFAPARDPWLQVEPLGGADAVVFVAYAGASA